MTDCLVKKNWAVVQLCKYMYSSTPVIFYNSLKIFLNFYFNLLTVICKIPWSGWANIGQLKKAVASQEGAIIYLELRLSPSKGFWRSPWFVFLSKTLQNWSTSHRGNLLISSSLCSKFSWLMGGKMSDWSFICMWDGT